MTHDDPPNAPSVAPVDTDRLRRAPLFSGCTPDELDRLTSLVVPVRVDAGSCLMTEGTSATRLLVILEGVAAVTRGRTRINTVRAGDFIGELAAVQHQVSSATVTAETPMFVLEIPAHQLGEVLTMSDVATRVMERLISWLQPSDDDTPTSPARPRRTRRRGDDDFGGWDAITVAERRVVDLVAAGFTNPEVAERLYISRHTVESHLKSIYAKLGIESRTQLAVEVHTSQD